MYRVSAFFRKLTCFDTESIHSSDKFALSGVISSDSQEPKAIYMPTIRLNDDKLPIYVEREFDFFCDSPKIGISLVAWDLDSGDAWKESEEDIKDATKAIAAAAKLVPKYGTVVSVVISAVSTAVIETINIFNGWDKDDKLLEYNEIIDISGYGVQSFTRRIRFRGSDAIGYSSWDYELVIDFWWEHVGSFAQSPALSGGAKAAQIFRSRATLATAAGFVGAFPNFYWVRRQLGFVSGTVFLRRTGAEWRDVPLAELEDVALEDFEGRMKATNVYAKKNGYEGGFPNYFHADYGSGIVCGTILLKSGAAEWRDVRLAELNNPALDDIEARFKATQDYALKNGFEGGFPDFFHDEKLKIDPSTGQRTSYMVCGTVLVKQEFMSNLDIGAPRRMRFSELRDV